MRNLILLVLLVVAVSQQTQVATNIDVALSSEMRELLLKRNQDNQKELHEIARLKSEMDRLDCSALEMI
ncbi:MAG: hypothetical protein ACI87V_001870 [Flavobacteriales bacterium]|jgi:hypothetical protein